MRIVIDTNVVASAIFFGGRPAALLRMVITRTLSAVATDEIVDEYQETVNHLMQKYSEKADEFSLIPIISAMEMIPASDNIHICRDPDDDKFISCASTDYLDQFWILQNFKVFLKSIISTLSVLRKILILQAVPAECC